MRLIAADGFADQMSQPQAPIIAYKIVQAIGKTKFGGVKADRFKVLYQLLISGLVDDHISDPIRMSDKIHNIRLRNFVCFVFIICHSPLCHHDLIVCQRLSLPNNKKREKKEKKALLAKSPARFGGS